MKHQALTLTVVMTASLALPDAARADTYWQAGTGDWSTGINWTNGEPGGSDYAYINNGGTAEITLSGEECRFLSLGYGSGQSGNVHMTSGSLWADWYEFIGRYGTGTFTQTGGTNTVSGSGYGGLYLGYYSGSSGTYELSGTAQLSSNEEYIGRYGTGTFMQTGGTNTVSSFYGGYLYLGYYSGSSGTYELSGTGQLSAGYSEYIGYEGTGTFTQTGGTNTVGSSLYLGRYSGSSGTYELSGTGQLSAGYSEYIGSSGTGTFTQTGGTNTVDYRLYLGCASGSSGTYELSGTGQLSADREYIGVSGTGTFTQTGGTNTVSYELCLGENSGSSGTYELSGTGQLWADSEYIGEEGTGTFTQTGGTNTVDYRLYLGYESGSSGTYELSGTGQLSARYEYIGFLGTGTFTQTGGGNTTGYLSINSTSRYEFSGGTLQINDGLNLEGDFDFAGSSVTLSAGSALVNFSRGNLLNTSQATVTVGPDSLTIVPSGLDPYTAFANFSTQGMVHEAGNTLVVGPGEGFAGMGNIDDHVDCAGTIAASADGFINLNAGVSISGSGSVDLGSDSGGGTLTTENQLSNMSGGQLSARYEYIGDEGTGTFTQTGGTNTVSYELCLGENSGSSGTYELSGTGQLSAGYNEYIGYSGTGTFTQTGGTNTVSRDLCLGYRSGSSGTYELSGTAQLSADDEYIGSGSGTGTFTQTGGTNSVSTDLYLGRYSGSSGTYTISGGQLSAGPVYVGYGTYGGEGTFKVIGDDAIIDFDSYTQVASGELYSIFDSDGLSLIDVLGIAELAGDWYIEDPGLNAPFGTFDVLTAGGGILGSFSNVYLPDTDWSWGIDGGTLWIGHVPEPATLSLLTIGGLAMLRRKRK